MLLRGSVGHERLSFPLPLPASRQDGGTAHFHRHLAAASILILGYPRSGTSWLAKIFDSHPDVLYRHEPDELSPPDAGADSFEQIVAWIGQRGLRSAGKRPIFAKSWRPARLDAARRVIMNLLAVAERLPGGSVMSRRVGVPDFVSAERRHAVRAVIKLVNWDGSAAARALPDCRCVLILRHPCGQIASILAGVTGGRFRLSSGTADHAAAAGFASRHGVDAILFETLPIVAQLAWFWRAFNEAAVEGVSGLPNAKLVIYDDLCRHPEAAMRDLFSFAGLDWHSQTGDFIDQSTTATRPSGYYDVFRTTSVAADQWRETMPAADQAVVRSVVAGSRLAHFWPDLAMAAACPDS